MNKKSLVYALTLLWGFGPAITNAQTSGATGGTTALVAPTITTAQIVSQTEAGAASCLAYRVIGVCVWLTYDWPAEYGISTTTRVGHYIPDVVVSSYLNSGKNPWVESNAISATVVSASSGLFGSMLGGFALGGGNSINAETTKSDSSRVKFKNVDILGNPIVYTYRSTSYSCGSVATMLYPYYVSDADIAEWRFGLLEMLYPQASITFLRNIGVGFSQWGSVYPRTGALAQNHDYKAGAVMAERAGDFVTRQSEPHIYTSLYRDTGSDGDNYVWFPPPLMEGDATTGYWQMLLPHAETSCYVFADVDDSLMGPVDPNLLRINPFEDYVWNLWRPYSCCHQPNDAIDLLFYSGTFP